MIARQHNDIYIVALHLKLSRGLATTRVANLPRLPIRSGLVHTDVPLAEKPLLLGYPPWQAELRQRPFLLCIILPQVSNHPPMQSGVKAALCEIERPAHSAERASLPLHCQEDLGSDITET